MSSSQINAWLEAAHEDVGRLLAPTSDGHEHRPAIVHAIHRAYDARPALPGVSDGERVSGSRSTPAPPGFGQVDPGAADRKEAHTRAERIRQDADWLVRFAASWNPRTPTPKDRELSSINGKDDPGCEHCHTIGKWSAVYKPRTTCNGNFDDPKALCSWCWRYCLDTGDMPTRKQLEDHHNGVRVKRPA